MVVTVFGLGFVGLTTALGLAEIGHLVYGIEPMEEKTRKIRAGLLPFFEPGLDQALARHLGTNFILADGVKNAVQASECIFYCVGTPYGENGEANVDDLFTAIRQALEAIEDNKFRVLVIKSTVPPTTTRDRVLPFVEQTGFRVGEDLGVANNPEFLREGHCWDDFMNPDRIVLGVSDESSSSLLKRLYAPFKCPVFTVSLNTGEFIKYLSNTLLATMISYSNEMSMAADAIGDIEISKAFRIIHLDKRWGGCGMSSYVYPGIGYGGYCLPKDTHAFVSLCKAKKFEPHILEKVISTNDGMPEFIFRRIARQASVDDEIGILGLAFKPGSDDVRDTPSAKIIARLLEGGYRKISAYDPLAIDEYKKTIGHDIDYCSDYETLCRKCDLLVIATAWDQFRNVREICGDKRIVDCRYLL